MEEVTYYLSADEWGDGKSVCLWRKIAVRSVKVARFQNDKVALQFAKDFGFPLSENLSQRLEGSNSGYANIIRSPELN